MNDDTQALLRVQGLDFAYPGQPLLRGWSARIAPGATLVQGDEGSGKTTLLRLLAGQLPADAGHLVLGGQALAAAPAAYRAQVFWQDPRCSALDAWTVRAWLQAQAPSHAGWDAQALAQHLQGFALQEHLDKTFHMLSTGSRRKVLMAAALASGALLTLIDEPVAGLDRPSVQYLQQALALPAHAQRALVVAHYEALPGVPWAQTLALPPAPAG